MSYVFTHFFIPLSILLIFSKKLNVDPRNIFILGFFGIMPDFDVIFLHRESFHNIFIFIIPTLMLILGKRKEIVGTTSFYLLSHLILDIFNGGISALYPIYDEKFFINAELRSSYNIDGLMLTLNYGIKNNFINNISKSGNGYGIISSENFAMILLILIVGIWYLLKKR